MNKPLFAAWAALAYLSFVAAQGWMFLFLADLGPLPTVDSGVPIAWHRALLLDLGLLLLFGLQHSGMARPGFKRLWTRLVPPALERATYVAAASLALALLLALWEPIPGSVWSVATPWARVALQALFVGGAGLALAASFQIDHAELMGLSQALGGTRRDGKLVVPFLYRFVRHPLQTGMLITLWATPEMSAGHLVFALALTLYIRIGLHFEERDLHARFGEDYRRYAERVRGRLLPALPGLAGRTLPGGALAAAALGALLLLGFGRAPEAAALPPSSALAVELDELERTALLVAPPGAEPAAGLLVALHPSRSSGGDFRERLGPALEPAAAARGLAVLYPDGYDGHWNDCRARGPYEANRLDLDDPGAIAALLDEARRRLGTPAAPAYALGHSNGGYFALRLALERPDLFAGVATFGVTLQAPGNDDCSPVAGAVPIFQVHGTADPIDPVGGGRVTLFGFGDRGEVLSAFDAAQRLAERNHAWRARARYPASDPRVERHVWRGAAPVELLLARGGGHALPAPGSRQPWLLGPAPPGLDLLAPALDFLTRGGRSPSAQAPGRGEAGVPERILLGGADAERVAHDLERRVDDREREQRPLARPAREAGREGPLGAVVGEHRAVDQTGVAGIDA